MAVISQQLRHRSSLIGLMGPVCSPQMENLSSPLHSITAAIIAAVSASADSDGFTVDIDNSH